MNTNTVAQNEGKRPSRPIPTTSDEDYALGCLTEARVNLERLIGLVTVCAEDHEMNDDEGARFRKLAADLACNIDGARIQLEGERGHAGEDVSNLLRGTEARDEDAFGVNYVGHVVPLRDAVDEAIDNIDGIVAECRKALDRACAMHVYAAGHCECHGEDSKWNAEKDIHGEFNDAMASAAGALGCLGSFIDCIRPGAAAKARAKAAEAARVMEKLPRALRDTDQLDAAAEE